jgi:hypothetical protein
VGNGHVGPSESGAVRGGSPLLPREVRELPPGDHALDTTWEQRIPQWTAQNPPLIDSSQPAISDGRPRLVEFYFVVSSGRKSVWTLVRQLRGPHLSTWA